MVNNHHTSVQHGVMSTIGVANSNLSNQTKFGRMRNKMCDSWGEYREQQLVTWVVLAKGKLT